MEPVHQSVPSGSNPSHLIGYTISNIISLRYNVMMASLLSLGLQVEAGCQQKDLSASNVNKITCEMHELLATFLDEFMAEFPPLCSGAEPPFRPIEIQFSHILIHGIYRWRQTQESPTERRGISKVYTTFISVVKIVNIYFISTCVLFVPPILYQVIHSSWEC